MTQAPTRDRRAALAPLLVGLVVRLLPMIVLGLPHTIADVGDFDGYQKEALRLLSGGGFADAGRLPGYPLFIAAVYGLTGRWVPALFLAQTLVGLAAIPLTSRLGELLFDSRVARWASFGVAVCYPLAAAARQAGTEAVYTPVLLWAIVASYRALDDPRPGRLLLAGGAWGVANLIRPNAVMLPFVLVVYLFLQARPPRRKMVGVLLGAVSLMVPICVHNAFWHGTLRPVASTAGALWQGSPEYYGLFLSGRSYMSIWENELDPARNGGFDVETVAGDEYFTARGWRSIRAEPWTYARYCLRKALWFWIGHPSADWGGSRPFTVTALRGLDVEHRLAVPWRALPLLLPFAAAVLWGSRRRLTIVYLVLVCFTGLSALTWAEARLSEPLLPLVILLIVAAASRLATRYGRRGPPSGERSPAAGHLVS